MEKINENSDNTGIFSNLFNFLEKSNDNVDEKDNAILPFNELNMIIRKRLMCDDAPRSNTELSKISQKLGLQDIIRLAIPLD